MLGHTYVHLLAPACTRLHLLAPAHTFRTRAGVRTCEFSHIRTFTHISKNFFAKKKKLRHPHHARCTPFASVRVWGHAKFRTSALSHTSPQFFLPKKHLHAHYKSTCVSLQIHTFALISTFFLKKLGRIQDE